KAKQDEAGAVVPDAIVNRRQKKKEKTFEYEVKWQFKSMENNTWVEKDTLVKMGYIKLVQREDERQAAMAGLMTKQLTQPGVEKHLADFGVDAESASHTQINQLSGGMKVKIVLAAAMWQNPHVLILDEPTNYLDRDGLGALVLAIKDYKGGVLIISHNKLDCLDHLDYHTDPNLSQTNRSYPHDLHYRDDQHNHDQLDYLYNLDYLTDPNQSQNRYNLLYDLLHYHLLSNHLRVLNQPNNYDRYNLLLNSCRWSTRTTKKGNTRTADLRDYLTHVTYLHLLDYLNDPNDPNHRLLPWLRNQSYLG
ncbi:NEW1, partial [Symbiodinium sp. CCMP2456]